MRLKVQINIKPGYPDFRRVAYQGSPAVKALDDILDAFRSSDHHFVPFAISRMPAYHQLKKYDYQNECRLIAKRHPGAHDCFPFRVCRDETQQCNYIDCSLRAPTCSLFQLRLLDVEGGASCEADQNDLNVLLEVTRGSASPGEHDESTAPTSS